MQTISISRIFGMDYEKSHLEHVLGALCTYSAVYCPKKSDCQTIEDTTLLLSNMESAGLLRKELVGDHGFLFYVSDTERVTALWNIIGLDIDAIITAVYPRAFKLNKVNTKDPMVHV